MNLAIRGIAANLGDVAADTFFKDQHPDLKADYIMANPPFNQKDWRATDELTNDPRFAGYDVPPKSNANYGWILHMASKLSENGVAGFILANGALSGDGVEKAIRKKMIENNLVEAVIVMPRNMFYTTDISVTLWILNKNKKSRKIQHGDIIRNYRDRENEILFMDLRQIGEPFEKKFTQFSSKNIQEITKTYHTWQQEIAEDEYKNIPEKILALNKDKEFISKLAAEIHANKIESSLSSLNSARYELAHGGNPTVSFNSLLIYFEDSKRIIEILDEVIV